MLIKCPKCGALISDTEKFCHVCGCQIERSQRRCGKCGMPLRDGVNFCSSCGTGCQIDSTSPKPQDPAPAAPIGTAGTPAAGQTAAVEQEKASPKWAWALATVPLVVGNIINAIVGWNSWYGWIAVVVLGCVFLALDIRELRRHGSEPSAWLFLGFVLIPVYLFVRASKTDRIWAYGIVWCILFAVDFIINLLGSLSV